MLTRDHLAVMSGITMTGNLYTMVRRKALTSADRVVLLTHLLRHIRGNVLVMWDGSPLHQLKHVAMRNRCGLNLKHLPRELTLAITR